MKKLIIWDFDGVIADTEKLWLETRLELLNRDFGLRWNFDTINKYCGGMSDKTKREILNKIGIITSDDFWAEALEKDIEKLNKGIKPVYGIVKILKNKSLLQCVATGGVLGKTLLKIKSAKIEKYIHTERLFTADMVTKGKPEPDLFLLAAQKMGVPPKNCVVVEDSIAGMTAGLQAGMNVVAFLGCEMNNNDEYINRVKNLGIKNLFFKMKDVERFLINFSK
ncbi:MAG: HAD family phosphatase [Rhodospirillales bacterium]|nr:HAD family phosphatase [Rhodospirillales bacterium]